MYLNWSDKKSKNIGGGGGICSKRENFLFCQLLSDNFILTFSKVFILIPRENFKKSLLKVR